MKPIAEYPRIAIVEAIDLRPLRAWLRSYALVGERFFHPLPEADAEYFGVDVPTLMIRRRTGELAIGDIFEIHRVSPEVGRYQLIGEYRNDVEAL